MPDSGFETRIGRVLGAYADDAVVPIDASRIALAAGAADRGIAGRLRALAAVRPSAEVRLVLVAAALLASLVIGTWLVGGSQRPEPALVDAVATPAATTDTATPGRTAAPATTEPVGPLAQSLVGTWMANVPDDLDLGDPTSSARMSLVIDTSGSNLHLATRGSQEWFDARLDSPTDDRLVVTTKADGVPVQVAGSELRGCMANEEATYAASRSPDGLLLTITVVDDPCPSRAAVFARTWVRAHGWSSGGGIGVVDAFDPLFTVVLPPGSYQRESLAVDSTTLTQAVPEFQFLAFRNPQGFLDPCNIGAGRYEIAPGADAIVDYFRQLEGFTVDSLNELEVDGHRAVRLVVSANADAPCARLAQWQPKAATTDQHWLLRPGDTDSLVIVELADDATLMFEVLPAPHVEEDAVIGSIRILDGLPTSP